ncbi:MAG: AMED_5909 family protein [Pseudonocardiaceae bacterium]
MTPQEGTHEPRTLPEAHEAVAHIRPRQKAPLTEWLAFHQRSAALYAEVAEIDRGHHHEALFMAEGERHYAKEIKTQIPAQQSVGDT